MMKKRTSLFLIIAFYLPITNVLASNYFNHTFAGSTLTIAPTFNPKAPNKSYKAGIKIVTPGFTLSQCTPLNNQFCTFPASTDAPANIIIAGPSGATTFTACLNATKNTANCENHTFTIPAIIFITQQGYTGDLNGVTGADALCNSEAYGTGKSNSTGAHVQGSFALTHTLSLL